MKHQKKKFKIIGCETITQAIGDRGKWKKQTIEIIKLKLQALSHTH